MVCAAVVAALAELRRVGLWGAVWCCASVALGALDGLAVRLWAGGVYVLFFCNGWSIFEAMPGWCSAVACWSGRAGCSLCLVAAVGGWLHGGLAVAVRSHYF